jgi:hypothetical protein
MPYQSTGLTYVIPYGLVLKGINEPEGSIAKKLAIEFRDLCKRLQELEYNEITLKADNVRLKAENEFMLKLINEWKTKEE